MIAPDALLDPVEYENEHKGEQYLLQMIALVEMADEQPFDRRAEQEMRAG